MGTYVLKRTSKGGGYVAKPGSKKGYVCNILKARVFKSLEEAKQDQCIENEIILSLDDILERLSSDD